MSSDAPEFAISVKGLTKTYRLFDHPADRIKQFLCFGCKQYYREFTALKDVSFEIPKGETIGIIGRNGSGKSTLLQLICGILTPTSGSVLVNGRISALLELGAGFNPEFTGRENVYFQGALMGFSEAQMNERFNDIAAFADIGDFIEQPVRTYSSGMFVRLAFSVAVHVSPEILVIDEALSVGDAIFVQKCIRYLNGFKARGGTILLVSHDTAAVSQLCQQAIWLERGLVKKHGTAQQIVETYFGIHQDMGSFTSSHTKTEDTNQIKARDSDTPDIRFSNFLGSEFHNEISIQEFPVQFMGYGDGGATLTRTSLKSDTECLLSTVTGGELVTLEVSGITNRKIESLIVGFFIKNRNGLTLFGDNTFLSYKNSPILLDANHSFKATFKFRLPILPKGEYSITVAAAEGTPLEIKQLHWVNEALILNSINNALVTGLVGLPMLDIQLINLDAKATY